MDVQEELKSLKERIAELESQVDEEQVFPKYKDFYWGVNAKGKVFCDTWGGFRFEKDMLSIGNVYQTENEAVLAVEKLKVEAELRKFSRPFVDGKENNHIKYRPSFDELSVSASFGYQDQGVFYFESEEKAQQAIQSVGKERIKKYIFGAEDL